MPYAFVTTTAFPRVLRPCPWDFTDEQLDAIDNDGIEASADRDHLGVVISEGRLPDGTPMSEGELRDLVGPVGLAVLEQALWEAQVERVAIWQLSRAS